MAEPDAATGNTGRSFIAGQFAIESTRRQRIFDWIFGVASPVFLSWPMEDWNLLTESALGHALFQHLDAQIHAYSLFALSTLVFVLLVRRANPAIHLLAGPGLFLGLFIMLLAGLLGLPGKLFWAVGLLQLGLYALFVVSVYLLFLLCLPWIAAFVFLRNGIRSLKVAGIRYGPIIPLMAVVLFLGILLTAAYHWTWDIPPWGEMVRLWTDVELF